ncbi:hypothetical protein KC726_04515 [Candidatus Woesebacteria bacterium]|nr:hypothetical protein [Candidatus Woesebacteria bacterium]
MDELSQRQIDILRAIIKEHTETGEAVGSEIIEKKYRLGVSPATIRNEMVALSKKGYLKKAHFSSGRIPSAKGFRFYINNLMKEQELSTVDEVAYKHSIWDEREKEAKVLANSARVLAEKTGLLSLVTTSNGELYYAGVANLVKSQFMRDLDVSCELFSRLDKVNFWEEILKQFYISDEDLLYILGQDDFKDPIFDTCASVFAEFESPNLRGIIGVVGPKYIHYEHIVPQLRFFSHLIGEVIRSHGA